MFIAHGEVLKNTVESLVHYVATKGSPVIANKQGTLEVLNEGFTITHKEPIDIENIKASMLQYYEENEIDYKNLEELEKTEYSVIMTELFEKFELFKQDKHSRQVLFTDDCCISMIHYLIRNNEIYCYMHMRSSDCEKKLFSDLYVVHKITRKLQDMMGINLVNFYFNSDSMHLIIYDIKE
jgi:thymidylate synthase